MHNFTAKLIKLSEQKYKEFSTKLIPDTKHDILGVRTPLIKDFAKNVLKTSKTNEIYEFLAEKHIYNEELLLHAFILSYEQDFDRLITYLNDFLPQIDNWAVCDSLIMALKIFKKYPKKSLEFFTYCLNSPKNYVKRFGIVGLLCYFLDNNFTNEILDLVLAVNSDNYYVNMGLSWFYSIALVKQYEHTVYIFENKLLPKSIHNKAIQKAIESFRIKIEIKNYLRTLKHK